MAVHFPDLNDEVRAVMLEEIRFDLERDELHMSNRLSPAGLGIWPRLLAHAAESGDRRGAARAPDGERAASWQGPDRREWRSGLPRSETASGLGSSSTPESSSSPSETA
jgi:hypothetical protein